MDVVDEHLQETRLSKLAEKAKQVIAAQKKREDEQGHESGGEG